MRQAFKASAQRSAVAASSSSTRAPFAYSSSRLQFSTAPDYEHGQIVSSIPANLQLADIVALKHVEITNSAMKENFSPIMYNYATLKVPKELPVISFTDA